MNEKTFVTHFSYEFFNLWTFKRKSKCKVLIERVMSETAEWL